MQLYIIFKLNKQLFILSFYTNFNLMKINIDIIVTKIIDFLISL